MQLFIQIKVNAAVKLTDQVQQILAVYFFIYVFR